MQRLRVTDHETLAFDPLYGVPNLQGPPIKINVLPVQPRHLADPDRVVISNAQSASRRSVRALSRKISTAQGVEVVVEHRCQNPESGETLSSENAG